MAMGQAAFTVLLRGTVLGVFPVFCYEAYTVGRDVGWIG